MTSAQNNEAYKRIHFAVMAIEASAKRLHTSGDEIYHRLKQQGLIKNRLLKYYDQLHTQSLAWVADDTIETLLNWEKEGKEDSE